MNLSKLIHQVWKDERLREYRFRKDEVKVIIEVLLDYIIFSLLTYGSVKIRGLFTLNIKKAKGRKIANPQTGEHMMIEDYNKIRLEPSKRLKEGMENYR